ncbi:MAG: sulfotransferase [Phycisphaerales bacterium]|nr:sulfotransferase [Phycisphaerales bacterium]
MLKSSIRGPRTIKTMFVVGLPRSGTTLLAHLLAGGPGLLTLSEPFLVHSVVAHWRLKRFLGKVAKTADLRTVPVPPEDADANEFLSYLKILARKNRFNALVIKETYRVTSHWENVALLDEIASEHAVAAILRHPFDVALSSIRAFHWCRGAIGRALRLWAPGLPLFANNAELVEHVGHNWSSYVNWCHRNATFIVSYEDLVRDPRRHLRAPCEACDFTFDEEMVNGRPYRAFGGIGDPTVVHRPKPVSKASVNRGRKLSPVLRELLLRTCGNTMSQLGYT